MLTGEKKGWICLDIDGTITSDILSIPKIVLDYLKELHEKNWQLVFVTGRTFSLAYAPLKEFNVPYYLIPQNGASTFKMPEKKLICKKYLQTKIFFDLEKLLKNTQHDFVLFGGYDQNENCYYRPNLLNSEIKEYFETELTQLASQIGCRWRAVDSFKGLQEEEFPYGKIYGERINLEKLQPIFEKVPAIKVHLVKDSVHPYYYILQIMKKGVDKGRAVLDLIGKNVLPKTIIAAGDDANDESLLEIADIKIAMPNSPKCLLDQASILAPSVKENGIIDALEIAILKAKDYE